jgi:hypothetical protein
MIILRTINLMSIKVTQRNLQSRVVLSATNLLSGLTSSKISGLTRISKETFLKRLLLSPPPWSQVIVTNKRLPSWNKALKIKWWPQSWRKPPWQPAPNQSITSLRTLQEQYRNRSEAPKSTNLSLQLMIQKLTTHHSRKRMMSTVSLLTASLKNRTSNFSMVTRK